MATILLIRHGQNDFVKKAKLAGRMPGVHLNDVGLEQAEALAKQLSKLPVKAIYSSPLERAIETANPIAKEHNLKVIKRNGLLELDIGTWQGKTIKQISRNKLWQVVQNSPSRMRFPEGETFSEAQLRIVNELESIANQHKSKEVICCVGHSDMIKLAIAYFLGLSLDHFQRLTVNPASVSTVHLGKSGTRIINVNHGSEFI